MNNPNKQEMSPNFTAQYGYQGMYQQEDEIDLFAVFLGLVEQWRWLVSITFIGTLIAVVFALGEPKVYEVEARLTQPTQEDISNINLNGYNKDFTMQEMFNKYFILLKSGNHFKDFIVKNGWLNKLNSGTSVSEDMSIAGMYGNLSIEVLEPKTAKGAQVSSSPTMLGIRFLSKDEALGVKLVNDYANYTSQDMLKIIAEEGKALRNTEKEGIELRIAALRKKAALIWAIKLDELMTAYNSAVAMNIKRPTTLQSFSQTHEAQSKLMVSVGTQDQGILSLMGTDYLQNEIDSLHKRIINVDSFIERVPELKQQLANQTTEEGINAFKNLVSNDPHITELPELINRLFELNHMTFDFKNAQGFSFDTDAMMTGKTKKSQKRLVVALGFVLSAMMAVFYVLIMNAWKKRSVEIKTYNIATTSSNLT